MHPYNKESLFGVCESMFKPDLGPDELFEVRRCKLDPNLKAPGFKGST